MGSKCGTRLGLWSGCDALGALGLMAGLALGGPFGSGFGWELLNGALLANEFYFLIRFLLSPFRSDFEFATTSLIILLYWIFIEFFTPCYLFESIKFFSSFISLFQDELFEYHDIWTVQNLHHNFSVCNPMLFFIWVDHSFDNLHLDS